MTTNALARPHSHGAEAASDVVPPKTKSQLLRSFDVADFPALNGREEDWRFTPLRRLRHLHDGAWTAAPAGPVHEYGDAPEGVTITRVAKDDARIGSVLVPFDRISAQAYTAAEEALVVSVARNAVVTEPVVLRIEGKGAEGASFGHTFLEIGESAEVTIVLDHAGSVTLADNVEIAVGANAKVTVVTVADWAPDAVQVQHQKARIGRDATLTHISVSLGGDLVRQYVSAEFAGPNAAIDAYGIYFADSGQHLEHRQLVDHGVPDCRSNVNYRGALQGADAHTVWVGDVLIQDVATGTETYEINRNLVLTDGARADSVPNLEIETGEILSAGHASATGRFDDEQLFYLQSRGIPEESARRLVVRGFFAELLEKIPVEPIRVRLHDSIEERLSKVGI
ncbi:Fe-S cluster assembly protein SufD [Phytomonospora endophytica]|uniref:Fe-S cluster assembly protein SufD n=1 Tax=Phytomonospora endophytica TaxID=714109 RepID=A0A841FPL7_9ACTN|nr:Fe-S cluster assembly protein SufD [Phytomonospora endophytica]MBB6033900.1 Fe-S cluster assembly protein SufD [Phytomonospora endophytica]